MLNYLLIHEIIGRLLQRTRHINFLPHTYNATALWWWVENIHGYEHETHVPKNEMKIHKTCCQWRTLFCLLCSLKVPSVIFPPCWSFFWEICCLWRSWWRQWWWQQWWKALVKMWSCLIGNSMLWITWVKMALIFCLLSAKWWKA